MNQGIHTYTLIQSKQRTSKFWGTLILNEEFFTALYELTTPNNTEAINF